MGLHKSGNPAITQGGTNVSKVVEEKLADYQVTIRCFVQYVLGSLFSSMPGIDVVE